MSLAAVAAGGCCCNAGSGTSCPASITIEWSGDASFEMDCANCDETCSSPFCRFDSGGEVSITAATWHLVETRAGGCVWGFSDPEDNYADFASWALGITGCNGADAAFCSGWTGDPGSSGVKIVSGPFKHQYPADSEEHWYIVLGAEHRAFFDAFGQFEPAIGSCSTCDYTMAPLTVRFRGPAVAGSPNNPSGSYSAVATSGNPDSDWWLHPTYGGMNDAIPTLPNVAGTVTISTP